MPRLVSESALAYLPLLSAKEASNWFFAAFSAFAISIFLVGILIRIAPGRGWVCMPRQDRWNARVVAQFGGVPILLACSAASLLFFPARQNWILMGLTWGMGLVGLADDLWSLKPRPKLLGQFTVAVLAVSAGFVHPLTSHFLVNAIFTIFWIVGITNAVNLLDNMDGLAAGIAIIGAAQVILLAGPSSPVRGLALCMLASVAGFLVFNQNPAKVFMGDVGALALGTFLACASVRTVQHTSSFATVLFVPCLILFIPLFDTALVSVTRRLHDRPISLGARDHSSHRLVFIGRSERHAVALLYFIAAIAGCAALLWTSQSALGAIGVAFFLMCCLLFWIYLARIELPVSWLSSTSLRVIPIPRFLRKAVKVGFFRLIDGAAIVLGLYLAYLLRFGEVEGAVGMHFRFTAALVLGLQIPLLIILDSRYPTWDIAGWRDAFRVFISSLLSAFLLRMVSLFLPDSRKMELAVILLGAALTSLLIVVCRSSARIFEGLLRKPNLAIEQQAHRPELQSFEQNPSQESLGLLAYKEASAPATAKHPS